MPPLSNWTKVFLVGGGSLFIFFTNGLLEAQSATMSLQLKGPDSPIKVTLDAELRIAGLGFMCVPIGAIFCGAFVDVFGRKKAIQLFYLSMSLGFGIVAVAQDVWHIVVGRAICAFGAGFEVCSVVYLAEISDKKQRTCLLGMTNAFFCCGGSLYFFIGRIPWNVTSTIFSILCLIFAISGFLNPESPQWLIKKNRVEEVINSYRSLGKSEEEIEKEIKISRPKKAQKFTFKLFLQPKIWKPVLILSIFHTLLGGTGLYNFFYCNFHLIKALGTNYSEVEVSLLITLMKLFASCTIGIFFMAKIGRKRATIVSGFLMGAAALGTGLYTFLLKDFSTEEKPIQSFPILCQILYLVSSSIAVFPLPWTMSGELFPLKFRGLLNGIVFVVGNLSIFASLKMYMAWVSFWKIYGYFFSISVPCFLLCLFGHFILPETQKKTLLEVEDGFNPKKKRKYSRESHQSAVALN